MNELTLQWQEAGQQKTHKIYEQERCINPGTVRIGRDPARCDILLTHPTVSGLHVEVFFHSQQHRFYLRNLRTSNPPVVDGQQLIQGEVALSQGSTIYLGQMQVKVIAVSVPATSSVPQTILIPPQPRAGTPHPSTPAAPPKAVYGLMCPKCHQISPYEQLNFGCRWCGTSLAAAVSALISPSNN